MEQPLLPWELIQGDVAKFLDVNTLVQLSATCKRMRASDDMTSHWRKRYEWLVAKIDRLCISRLAVEPTANGFRALVQHCRSNYKSSSRKLVLNTLLNGMLLPIGMAATCAISSLCVWVIGRLLGRELHNNGVVRDVPLANVVATGLVVYRELGKIDDLTLRFEASTVCMTVVYLGHRALGLLRPTPYNHYLLKHFGFPYLFIAYDWIKESIDISWSDPTWQSVRKSMKAVYESLCHWKKLPLFVRIK